MFYHLLPSISSCTPSVLYSGDGESTCVSAKPGVAKGKNKNNMILCFC